MSQQTSEQSHKPAPQDQVPARVVEALSEAVGRLRYGVVQLTVHDGRVVQLDVTERQRFT